MKIDKLYLTDVQVAEMTSIAVQTLRNNRMHGHGIPYIKLGKSVRYEYEEVIKFMDRHRVNVNGSTRIVKL